MEINYNNNINISCLYAFWVRETPSLNLVSLIQLFATYEIAVQISASCY